MATLMFGSAAAELRNEGVSLRLSLRARLTARPQRAEKSSVFSDWSFEQFSFRVLRQTNCIRRILRLTSMRSENHRLATERLFDDRLLAPSRFGHCNWQSDGVG